MAKEYDNKRKIAHHYYVEKNYTAKQVAEMLDITPKTVGEWVRKYAWKQERQAREISVRNREENRDRYSQTWQRTAEGYGNLSWNKRPLHNRTGN